MESLILAGVTFRLLYSSPLVARATWSGCSMQSRRSSSPAMTTGRSSTSSCGPQGVSLPPPPPAARPCGRWRCVWDYRWCCWASVPMAVKTNGHNLTYCTSFQNVTSRLVLDLNEKWSEISECETE